MSLGIDSVALSLLYIIYLCVFIGRISRINANTMHVRFFPLFNLFQTPASNYPGVVDDLIFSGAGSGCRGDDEDECTPPFESGSGDDLITPVYVPPTKQPTTPHKNEESSAKEACDDEDCIHGSGDSGTVTEPFTSTTSKGTGKIPFYRIIDPLMRRDIEFRLF